MQQTRIQENGSSTTIEVCKENEKKWPEYSMIGQKDWLKKGYRYWARIFDKGSSN